MTAEVDGHGQTRDVRGMHLDVHRQGGHFPTKSLRPDAERVHARQESRLEVAQVGPAVSDVDGSERGLLGETGGGIEGATDTHTDDDRWTRVGASPIMIDVEGYRVVPGDCPR